MLTTSYDTRVRLTEPAIASLDVASPEDAFRQLWSPALLKLEQSMPRKATKWQGLLKRLDRCHDAEDVCRILDEMMQSFERYRGSSTNWGKLRNRYLKPAVEVLMLFNDTIAETVTAFPNMPGGNAVFVALGSLLQATKGVSAYYEALVALFEELNHFLECLRPRLLVPLSFGSASKTIAVAILSHLVEIFVLTTKVLSKRPWLGRLALYGKIILKDATIPQALQRLRVLTDLEVRAITSEISVTVAETRDLSLETQEAISQMISEGSKKSVVSVQLLEELQALTQDRADAASSRGLLGRGMDKLLRGQHDMMAFLRAERESREKLDASKVYEKLSWVEAADIDAQSSEGCMKGTRLKVLADLRDWSRDPTAPPIYWLNGMAGTGKSAIARSFCHALDREGLLGGSFFCSRGGSVEEGDVRRIVPTLAASLAAHNPGFGKALLSSLEERRFFVSWNFKIQIERLIEGPFSLLQDECPTFILVIDALDECSDGAGMRDLIARLALLSQKLPVKFFLTSRPEPHIRDQLESLDANLGHILRLHDIEEDIVQADITLYLTQGLRGMRQASFPITWPSKSDITTLAHLSGKLFIYAFTVLQYVGRDPIARLSRLTGNIITAGRPMTKPLDDIYELILSEAMDPDENENEEIDLTRLVVAIIATVRDPLSVTTLGELLNMPPDCIRGSLNRLYAVIYVPLHNDYGVLSTFHASFGDFLNTPDRAPKYMRDPLCQAPGILAAACMDVLQSDRLHFNISQAVSSYLSNAGQKLAHIREPLRYACLHGLYHAARAYTYHSGAIANRVEVLLTGPKFLFWIEALSTMGHTLKAIDILETLQRSLSAVSSQKMISFLRDAIHFIKTCHPALSLSTPHIYLSALALSDIPMVLDHLLPSFVGIVTARSPSQLVVPTMHARPLHSAIYSPDGRQLLAACETSIHIFDSVAGQIVDSILTDHMVRGIAYSEDGARILSSSLNKTICVWRADTGELLSRLESDHRDVTCITFSPTGAYAAYTLPNHMIQTRDVLPTETWRSPRQLRGHMGHIWSIAFSPDESLLASGSSDQCVCVWDALTGKQIANLKGHFDIVFSVAFVHWTGTHVVSGSADRTVRVWDIRSQEEQMTLRGHDDSVLCVACSFDGKHIASGSLDRTLRIWDGQSGELAMRPLSFEFPVISVAFSPKGDRVVSVTEEGAIHVVDLRLEYPADSISPDGFEQRDCSYDEDGWIRGPNKELLLWLSRDQPREFNGGQLECVMTSANNSASVQRPKSITIDWTGAALGRNWHACLKAVKNTDAEDIFGDIFDDSRSRVRQS